MVKKMKYDWKVDYWFVKEKERKEKELRKKYQEKLD
jgi:hypothetical protein